MQPNQYNKDTSSIVNLRGKLRRIERLHSQQNKPWILSSSFNEVDSYLPEAGIPSHAVHAINGPSALFFLLRLLSVMPIDYKILWCRSAKAQAVPYGPAILEHGIDPERILFVQCHSLQDLLWSYEEALKSSSIHIAILEPEAAIKLIESRRLQLAAEIGGSIGFLISQSPDYVSNANAIFSRWHITPLPTAGLYQLELQRMRNAPPKTWQVGVLNE
ncbi:ImuA family protein, partial [Curvivirga aplysinae]|uniref:ImuA family protein n=1 Tax=Curvivirga aplysinae TaxID=2529852 RepID=UPI001C3F8B55